MTTHICEPTKNISDVLTGLCVDDAADAHGRPKVTSVAPNVQRSQGSHADVADVEHGFGCLNACL
jgi:hypothetical protein